MVAKNARTYMVTKQKYAKMYDQLMTKVAAGDLLVKLEDGNTYEIFRQKEQFMLEPVTAAGCNSCGKKV